MSIISVNKRAIFKIVGAASIVANIVLSAALYESHSQTEGAWGECFREADRADWATSRACVLEQEVREATWALNHERELRQKWHAHVRECPACQIWNHCPESEDLRTRECEPWRELLRGMVYWTPELPNKAE